MSVYLHQLAQKGNSTECIGTVLMEGFEEALPAY